MAVVQEERDFARSCAPKLQEERSQDKRGGGGGGGGCGCSGSRDGELLLDERNLNEILLRRLAGKEFQLANWSIEPLSETNGHLGKYYYINAAVRLANGSSRKLRFFAKTPPSESSSQYKFLTRYDTFGKEVAMYTDLLREMGRGKRGKWAVDCYLSEGNWLIVLEDATSDGYDMPDKRIPFDWERCVLGLKALSSLHSRSLILDEKLRRSGRSIHQLYGHLLKEVLFVDADQRSRKLLSASIAGSWAMVDLLDHLGNEEKARVKGRIDRWSSKISQLLMPSKRHRNVVCHRDLWANNIMFKLDSTAKPVGCYLVDFQFFCLAPPTIDVACFLYLTTDRSTRDRYFDSFVKIYYDAFETSLADENLDIRQYYPWESFLESLEEARSIAIIYATLNLQIMLMSREKVEEYFGESTREDLEEILYSDKRADLVGELFKTSPFYRERNTEVILDVRDRLPDYPPDV
ncbi:uncharacterized protein [Prorops nasuta]|uniref:uncharacterized protein n=1 Tax=Prorops nasuta TaxID=863751 RepID=UPI0034CEB2CB